MARRLKLRLAYLDVITHQDKNGVSNCLRTRSAVAVTLCSTHCTSVVIIMMQILSRLKENTKCYPRGAVTPNFTKCCAREK